MNKTYIKNIIKRAKVNIWNKVGEYPSRRGGYAAYAPMMLNEKIIGKIHKNIKLEQYKYYQLCSSEFKALIAEELDYETFRNSHPFWTKDTIKLLKSYHILYSSFIKKFKTEREGSKNIMSCHNDTCISSIQLTPDKCLVVTQRSCDLSLGLFADACAIKMFADYVGAKKIKWFIVIPHIYLNNCESTFKYLYQKSWKRPKFVFNVR